MSVKGASKQIGLFALSQTKWMLVIMICFVVNVVDCIPANDDNDFAEFEEFDSEEFEGIPSKPKPGSVPSGDSGGGKQAQEQRLDQSEESSASASTPQPKADEAAAEDEADGEVEEEDDDDFSHLEDEDEFEKADRGGADEGKTKQSGKSQSSQGPPQLKITDVPAHLRNNWLNFQVELVLLFGLLIYLANYLFGKSKNQSLANAWFEQHREILEENFYVVGDNGVDKEPSQGIMLRDSDHQFTLWCSGRSGCRGMLVQMKLLKRQDIVNLLLRIVKPANDQVIVKVFLGPDDMDSFVFAIGKKKSVTKLAKEMSDLYSYTTEKKNVDKLGLSDSYVLFSEIGEVTPTILDQRVTSILSKFEDYIDYIHISDQFCGQRLPEGESHSKLPEVDRVLIFSFIVPGRLMANERQIEAMRPLMGLVFHLLEKIKRFRLSREAKGKAEKNRQRIEADFLKTTHAQRQEAAQQRREEKVRERKEKILAEEDPEKQKKLEEIERKREMKEKRPRMKQLKIKQL